MMRNEIAARSFAGPAVQRSLAYGPSSELSGEIVSVGEDIIASQPLVDKLYEFYIALLTRGWVGDKSTAEIADIGFAYLKGFYFPCQRRPVLAGEVDLRNDHLPDYAGLINYEIKDGERTSYFISARQCPLPRGMVAPCRGEPYKLTVMWRDKRDRIDRRRVGDEGLRLYSWPVLVRPDGRLWACKDGSNDWTGFASTILKVRALDAAAAFNAWVDRRFLWQVETSEPLLKSAAFRTPLLHGCGEEHIKSLFYAREAPLTETGRKRPILHWVRAHERRLREGVDIDVRRHMRGIIEFEMAGFPFRIVSPVKGLG